MPRPIGQLEDQWLKDLFIKYRSQVSNILCIETNDHGRYLQLEKFLKENDAFSEDNENLSLMSVDNWEGLRNILNHELSDVTGCSSNDSGGHVLKSVLLEIERQLKRDRSIVIIRNMESVDEAHFRHEELVNALRHWAYDADITERKSLILLITPDISSILDSSSAGMIPIIKPPISSREERSSVIRNSISLWTSINPSLPSMSDVAVEDLAKITSGLNIYQLDSLMAESYQTACLQSNAKMNSLKFDISSIKKGKREIINRSRLIEVYEPEPKGPLTSLDHNADIGGFENVGGYEEVKRYIKLAIANVMDATNKERAEEYGVKPSRGILFFGPPGTGKTILSKALAEAIAIPFIKLNTEDLFSKWLGESAQRFKQAVNLCDQMSPAIVFIDEIDKLGRRRSDIGDGASEETRKVYNLILEWLGDERRNAILIGTTNRPADLDEAFLRPGRIDEKIPILFPDEEARKKILEIHLGIEKTGKRSHPPISKMDEIKAKIADIAKKAKNYSGADLEYIVRKARLIAFNSQSRYFEGAHLEDAFGSFIVDPRKKAAEYQDSLDRFIEYVNPEFRPYLAAGMEDLREYLDEEFKSRLQDISNKSPNN